MPTVTSLDVYVHSSDLFPDQDDAAYPPIDFDASCVAYANHLAHNLHVAYPSASIRVHLLHGLTGPSRPTLVVSDSDDPRFEDAARESVGVIENAVWETFGWVVYLAPTSRPNPPR